MNVYDKLIAILEVSGIETIFSFPGETTLPLYQSIFLNGKIKHITAGCERCAGFMADVYSRFNNKVGVFTAPGGVGSPWTIPALHEAFNSSIPIFLIVSGVSTLDIGNRTTSECNQIDMVKPFCKAALRLENPNKLEDSIRILIRAAISSRPGPVMLEIPTDIGLAKINNRESYYPIQVTYPINRGIPRKEDLHTLVKNINESSKAIIVAGGGVHISNAATELNTFSKKYNIPVLTTLNGKGSYDEYNVLSLGVIGNKGGEFLNRIIEDFDLVLILGSKMGDKSTNNRTLYKSCKIYRIDINDSESENIYKSEFFIKGDIKETLKELIVSNNIKTFSHDFIPIKDKISFIKNIDININKRCSISYLMMQINLKYRGEVILCADASSASGWVGTYAQTKLNRRCIISPRGSGSLGYGLPAVIAASFCSFEYPVIGLGGDTGFLMSCHEIDTAVQYNLKFIYFIINNNSLGLLDRNLLKCGYKSDLLKRKTYINWKKVISGFGGKYYLLKTNKDIVSFFNNIEVKGPVFVEILIDNDTPPDFH